MGLTEAMVRLRGKHEIILALNGTYYESCVDVRNLFLPFLTSKNILTWYPVKSDATFGDAVIHRDVSESLYEHFIYSLKPDLILMPSIFDGDSITRVPATKHQVPIVVVLYDLIPLIFKELYLADPNSKSLYSYKLDQLKSADLILSISESARQDAIKYLFIPPERLVNISSAIDSRFKVIKFDDDSFQSIRAKYKIERKIIMYTGGSDWRKNIDALIRAYARLKADLRESYQLVIVCAIVQGEMDRLYNLARKEGLGDNDVVLTGYVSESEMVALYNRCELFVFPSWYEGFGLPALEAMACGAPTIVSNTSSLPEVMGREDVLFDPYNDQSIAEKITQVLTDDAFKKDLRDYGLVQSTKFSWDKTAQRALDAMEAIASNFDR
ncbi:MAG: glycosyltransferase family 4 protein [Burkholderiales bacterium]|jgi:glycosyltransferase involved in cell wall biosynthesis|nr:glycosyltransferase family 4 protein [Burkholderiales bacterium]